MSTEASESCGFSHTDTERRMRELVKTLVIYLLKCSRVLLGTKRTGKCR